MKPVFEVIPHNQELSFRAEMYYDHWFNMPLHFHSQFEIVYIKQGYGNRIVGDSLDKFETGDLVMIDGNLPHFWRSHHDFYVNPEMHSESIFIQFSKNIFPLEIESLVEYQFIYKALEKSKFGIKVSGATQEIVLNQMETLLNKKGIERIILLYEIIDLIGRSADTSLLCSKKYVNSFQPVTEIRLKKVLDFLQENYCSQISLKEISKIAGMNTSSFCRYFRQKMQRTCKMYIHEKRVDYACKLLLDKRLTIDRIAYECGFNSLSFFNEQFKLIKGVTPSIFRKRL